MVDHRIARTLLPLLALTSLSGVTGCSGDDGKNGNAGSNGTSCTVTADEEAGTATIVCTDGTEAVVTGGEDGASCTVDDNADGTKTITCDDGTTVTVEDGTTPEPCTVEDNGDGTKTVTCGEDSIVVSDGIDGIDGIDGAACTVEDNGDGSRTIECEDGTTVTIADGQAGENGLGVLITDFHGTETLMSTGAFADGKFLATAQITSATADESGLVTVDFTVDNADGDPVLGLSGISANISRLEPAYPGESWNRWVPYVYRTQTVVGVGSWPAPDGTSAVQGWREDDGTLTDHGDGSYTYEYATDISNVTGYDGTAVTYDRSLRHRVVIMMGGATGATATAFHDFVPDGSAMTESRDIMRTENCQQCHGQEFLRLPSHGGDRLIVQSCVTCHNAGNVDPHSGESLDLKVMIHKIHAGGELLSIPGADGKVWDDPATPGTDESADNGRYAIWTTDDVMNEWWDVGYPANIENCTKCHQGEGTEADNWKENPSRAACGSCHDDVDFATGTNHAGGAMDNDDDCAVCHRSEGAGLAPSVADAHDWIGGNPRQTPEFDISLTVSAPANGSYFVDGESPIVTMVLTNPATGLPIDHTTVVEDATGEGCTLVDTDGDGEWDPCPAGDGQFRTSILTVHGPRARRMPVLTTASRVQIVASGTGPFDLSAANASLVVKFDGGQNVHSTDVVGGDVLLAGTATINVAGGPFASTAAATTAEIIAWLNANAAFAARGIAFDNGAGRVGIRSRNLGTVYSMQLQASNVATQVFAGNLNPQTTTGSYASNNVAARTNPANNDPKAVRSVANITYTLDPVDDLAAGTYIVRVNFADAGSVTGQPQNYRAGSITRTTFQVGTPDDEPLIARNCGTCHQSMVGADDEQGGVGLGIHTNYWIEDEAMDHCGGCHDWQPQYVNSVDPATGQLRSGLGSIGWTGAKPHPRRIHAVHMGANLNYPMASVDRTSDTVAGRQYRIEFPRDVRNCQVCHTAETSGTWATRPSRLPCMGCHDSDAAMGHIRQQTFDPTPADPWSGDEQESCAVCHAPLPE